LLSLRKRRSGIRLRGGLAYHLVGVFCDGQERYLLRGELVYLFLDFFRASVLLHLFPHHFRRYGDCYRVEGVLYVFDVEVELEIALFSVSDVLFPNLAHRFFKKILIKLLRHTDILAQLYFS